MDFWLPLKSEISDNMGKQCAGIYPARACWWLTAPKPPQGPAQLRWSF